MDRLNRLPLPGELDLRRFHLAERIRRMFKNALLTAVALAASGFMVSDSAHGQTWVTTSPTIVSTNYRPQSTPVASGGIASLQRPSSASVAQVGGSMGSYGMRCPVCGDICQCPAGNCSCGSCPPGCQCACCQGNCNCRNCQGDTCGNSCCAKGCCTVAASGDYPNGTRALNVPRPVAFSPYRQVNALGRF
jgi:hypothetical protein